VPRRPALCGPELFRGLVLSGRGRPSGARSRRESTRQADVIALVVALRRSCVHLLLAHSVPVHPVSRLGRQFADKFPLRPTIAFSKGMKGIQFSQVVARPAGESVRFEALQVVFRGQSGKGLIEVPLHKLDHGKRERCRARDVDLAQFASPGINLLEDPAMGLLQVGLIEFSVDRCFFQPGEGFVTLHTL
jgi:hypothetical protein